MLKTSIVNAASKTRNEIQFFEDDTIKTIRQRIGIASNVHPDRLFILAKCSRPKNYYVSDPRHWEALYTRLSYKSKSILEGPFNTYIESYRTPTVASKFQPISHSEWMSVPDAFQEIYNPQSDFFEYTIFGVAEHRSYVLPLNYSSNLDISKIPSADYPIPQQNTLFHTLYGQSVVEFMYFEFEADAPQTIVYFPFYRLTTPERVSIDTIQTTEKTDNKLQRILSLNPPLPTHISLLRTRFRIPFIDTDFGDAVRSRFEQIMYGQTVSTNVQYIGMFTGNDEVARHKFFADGKRPVLNVSLWKSWYTTTKPARNRPTLLLYRGKSHRSFDRIAITSTDIIATSYRSEKELTSFAKTDKLIESIQKDLYTWLLQFDGVLPFLKETDIHPSRWELQDTSAILKYTKKIEEYDLRRLPSFSFLFDIADKETSTFRLLRADVPPGARDTRLIEILQQNPDISTSELEKELDITLDEAQLIREDPDIMHKLFRGFPTFRIGETTVLVSSTPNLETTVEYANILRYVLGSDDSNPELDAIGGKRMERIPAVVHHKGGADSEEEDEYADLWGTVDEPPKKTVEEDKPATDTELLDPQPHIETLKTYRKGKQRHNYFNERLREFDPITFTSEKSEYPKKCEQSHQPIILSELDLDEIDPEFDPRKWDSKLRLEVDGPNGKGYVICPEYWCMYDEIPLTEGQLKDINDGFLRCPVCSGKVQKGKDDDPREFPVIARDKSFIYPGYLTKYKSPINAKPLPCCYKVIETLGKKEDTEENKYYLLGETKDHLPPKRLAFIPRTILQALKIPYTYDKLQGREKRRLVDGDSSIFRVGLHTQPSKIIPELLGLSVTIPRPRDVPDRVLKCSFASTWANLSDEAFDTEQPLQPQLKRIVAGIDRAFMDGELTPLQDLEYTCIILNCDVYRVRMDTKTVECTFFNRSMYTRHAIAVLQLSPDDTDIDILCHVTRIRTKLKFQAGLYSSKDNPSSPFKKETTDTLETLRTSACSSNVPGFTTALNALQNILYNLKLSDDFSIVLDPFMRAQAFYIPRKLLLPFAPTPLPLVKIDKPTISGFEAIEPPTYADVREYINIAKDHSNGFEWKEDVTNTKKYRVELLLSSGLRIPVQPEKAQSLNVLEVTDTIKTIGEEELAFGGPDERVKNTYDSISYASEVFDFLLFSLSNDIKEKYPDLREALKDGRRSIIQPVLREWFDRNVYQSSIENPETFLSKIRTPCGQFKSEKECKGNVCGWNGTVCRIEVRKRLNKEILFGRLLSAMVANAKLRSIVLDGRSTPFFSTVLYLELPHELIMTDNEISSYL